MFLEDYDIQLARWLVTGVDVWLNNPIAPLEASGTSGIKAAVNGRLNLSILDGWWSEAWDGHNGWGIPGADVLDEGRRDCLDGAAMLDAIEEEVVPLYYARNAAACRRNGSAAAAMRWRRSFRASTCGAWCVTTRTASTGRRPRKAQMLHGRRRCAARSSWPTGSSACASGGSRVRILEVNEDARGEDGVDAPLRMQARVQLGGLHLGHPRGVQGAAAAADGAFRSAAAVFLRHIQPKGQWRAEFTPAGGVAPRVARPTRWPRFRPTAGQYQLEVRIYPWHPLLTHPLEMGLLKTAFDPSTRPASGGRSSVSENGRRGSAHGPGERNG